MRKEVNEFKNFLENINKEFNWNANLSDIAEWYGIRIANKVKKSKLVEVNEQGFIKLKF